MNENKAKQMPVKAWKSKTLDVTVWEKTNEYGTFYNVKAVHRFKSKVDDRWNESSSFEYTDIPLLLELLEQAFKVALKADCEEREAKRTAVE